MTDNELKAFIRAEVRKALAEVVRDLRVASGIRAECPPRSTEVRALPAWARHEEGTTQ